MGVPSFGLDRPYKLFHPAGQAYWKKSTEEFVEFLEQQTGKKMDYDHPERGGPLSYKATKALPSRSTSCAEDPRLRSSPRHPRGRWQPTGAWVVVSRARDFLTEFRDELKERVAKGPRAPFPRSASATSATPAFPLRSGASVGAARGGRYKAVNVMDMLQWWREDGDC